MRTCVSQGLGPQQELLDYRHVLTVPWPVGQRWCINRGWASVRHGDSWRRQCGWKSLVSALGLPAAPEVEVDSVWDD